LENLPLSDISLMVAVWRLCCHPSRKNHFSEIGLRLCRFPRKASGFPPSPDPFDGYAARGEASPFEVTLRKAGDFPHERRQSRNSMARRS